MNPEEQLAFECSPDLPCFNLCCSDLILRLTPYDILRLAFALGCSPWEIIERYCDFGWDRVTGFPRARLLMLEGPGRPCPFVGEKGCAVYPHRPGACRAFPLGRGARLGKAGVSVCYYWVESGICQGIGLGSARTPDQWLASQGLAPYNASNDKLMRLLSMINAGGKPVDADLQELVCLALFDPAGFRDLLKGGLLEKFELEAQEGKRLFEATLAGAESSLSLAMDWLELLIFGTSPNLRLLPD